MKNFRKSLIMVLGAVVLLVPTTIHAVSGTVGNAATSMAVGATKDINIVLMSADDVQAIGGKIESNDATCVKINSMEAVHNKADVFGSKFALAANGAVPANTVMIKVNVTGLKECSTTFKYTTVKVTSTSAVNAPATISAGTITVGGSTPTPKSNDNTLSGITVSTGTLSPAFSASNTVYTVTVPNDVTSITVTGTKNNSKATVTGPVTKELSEGENTITITCTAEDGTPRTYTVKVTREGSGEVKPADDDKSNDATLKSLDVSGYTLTPTFKSDVLTYSMSVGSNIDALNVTAIANHEKATVAVSGNTNFKPGMNTIYVTVTAENGTKKTYTVNVKKAGGENNGTTTTAKAKSSNNYLSNILVADGELSPAFNKEVGSYSITVPKDTTKLDLKAFAEDSNAKVEVLDNDNLQVGSNTITIRVTAEDGSVRIYTLNVTKSDKESNTDIEKIIIGGGKLNPEFDPGNNYYETEVPGGTKSININAIPKNPKAKVEYLVNGKAQTDGNINLDEGYNLVTVKVTDENGFTKMYYINAYRKPYSYNLFGMKVPKWLVWLLGFLLLGLIALIIFFLLKKDDDDEEEEKIENKSEIVYPKIEFKPEFNFGSKNNDNDTVTDGAVLNQESSNANSKTEKEENEEVARPVESVKDTEEVPYDPYDEVVTVDELIDAIGEKDPKKLRILYEQEMLNRKKEALKNSSEKGRHAKKDDDYEEE